MSTQSSTKAASKLAEQAVNAFAAQLQGDLILPSDARYDEVRKVYNAMIDKRPALIARCKDVAPFAAVGIMVPGLACAMMG